MSVNGSQALKAQFEEQYACSEPAIKVEPGEDHSCLAVSCVDTEV